MGQDAFVHPGPSPQQAVEIPDGNAVGLAVEHALKGNACVGLEHERCEEVIAELAIRGPDTALAKLIDRGHIDDDRAGPAEDHVERRSILEDETLFEGNEIGIKSR